MALEETGLGGVIEIDKVRQFFDHPGFVEPFIEGVRKGLAEVAARGIPVEQTHVLFATHSIPDADAERSGPRDRNFGHGGAYAAQHLAVAEVVIAAQSEPFEPEGEADQEKQVTLRTAPLAWDLVYQSRSGPPTQPWLEPDINDRIEELAAEGVKAVVIVPLGFISDHMEVKWDLDTEALETAEEHDIFAVRVPTPGVHEAFVSGLIDLVLERRDGIPTSERPALTELGPWYDVCRPGCCENVRLGFKPALAGIAP
jgi:ferrochelatase